MAFFCKDNSKCAILHLLQEDLNYPAVKACFVTDVAVGLKKSYFT